MRCLFGYRKHYSHVIKFFSLPYRLIPGIFPVCFLFVPFMQCVCGSQETRRRWGSDKFRSIIIFMLHFICSMCFVGLRALIIRRHSVYLRVNCCKTILMLCDGKRPLRGCGKWKTHRVYRRLFEVCKRVNLKKKHTLDKRNLGKKVAAGGARIGERERETRLLWACLYR